MSDDNSVERRREEARMKELLKVAMGKNDIPETTDSDEETNAQSDFSARDQAKSFLEDLDDDDGKGEGGTGPIPAEEHSSEYMSEVVNPHQHTDSGLKRVSIGGPEPKPPKPPSRRRDLHNSLAESVSASTRDKTEGTSPSKAPNSFSSSLRSTVLSDSIFGSSRSFKQIDSDEVSTSSWGRIFRYDLVVAMLLIFSIVGAAGMMFFLIGQSNRGAGVSDATSSILPLSSGPSSSGRCDAIVAKLNNTTYVNAQLLEARGTAQNQALLWICNEDPAQLPLDDDFFLPRYVLAVLFYSTSGRVPSDTNSNATDWNNSTNWLSAEGYCSWYGIGCIDEEYYFETEGNGMVFEIDLSDNMLRGTLPAEASALSDLVILNMNTNYIAGTIPSEFGRMANVSDLFLANNKLKGSIPSEIGSMKELRKMTLAENDLTETLPETFGQLSHLTYLALEDNFLTGTLPSSLSSLSKLETFHASSNKLVGPIPAEFYDMTALMTVRLSDNALTGTISAGLNRLSRLEKLHLVGNEISGTIPDSFADIAQLEELHLGYNSFVGSIPESLGKNNLLERLSVEGNGLTGYMPDSVCDLAEAGILIHVAADCYEVGVATNTVLDLSDMESVQTGMAGEMGQLTEEEEILIEQDGIVCGCCTLCF